MRILILAIILAPLKGQDFHGQITLKSLVPPLSQPWKSPLPAGTITLPKLTGAARPCAIPLLKAKPNDTDSKMTISPPAAGFHVRQVTPPAPSCEETTQP